MPESSSSAEELFAEYLLALEEGAEVDFDEWVARHPASERELRDLREGDRVLEGYVEEERGSASRARTSFFGAGPAERTESVFQESFSVGDRIGDYQLLEPLGTGGMGQVWRAMQLTLNRPVALKLVKPGRISPETLERFAREARAGGRLSHQAIIAIHGFGESGGVHWIAMELVQDGWTLRGFIDRARLLEELPRDYYQKVAELVAELADALQAAHDANVIHRDIKPQNILITPDDRPKLTDFGLARITDETALTRTGEFAGTYLYMSPEQVAAGRMGIDHRSDVFSLGVVLYELLGLLRPFEGDTTHQVAAKILTEEPPDLRAVRSRVPHDLAVIAGKALEKKRQDRYQSMAELAADLRRYLGREPVLARPPGMARRARKWIERHPTRSVAVALLVLGLAGTAAASVWALRNASDARAERDRVFGLVASMDLRRLQEEVRSDDLWPAVPTMREAYQSWLERARLVVAGLHPDPVTGDPGHLAVLEELRARGEPFAPEPDAQGVAAGPELQRLRGLLEAERRAQQVRRGELFPELGPLDSGVEPDDVSTLLRRAWRLVAPGRTQFGEEHLGYGLALAALGREPEEFATPLAFRVWCEAALAIGLEEEVLGEVEPFGAQLTGPSAASFALFVADFVPRAENAEQLAEERILALEQQVDALTESLRGDTEWRFDDHKDRWWHDHLAGLVAEIEAFADPDSGPIHGNGAGFGWGVERRREWAAGIRAASIEGAPARAAWFGAVASIADVERSPMYGGLRIEPQLGLLPLGPDPDSGLWEFACLQSGEPAERDEDGHIRRRPDMGIVLVLIPGGEYDGEQLEPFFLSKYEMTQAQWEHVAIENPSTYTSAGADQPGVTPLNPVETVSWVDCSHIVEALGLELPSELRWRYAAGWSTEPIPVGATPGYPSDSANLGDEISIGSSAPLKPDGFSVHAPVGSFPANELGLHDLRGNVSEWCSDRQPTASPDGTERTTADTPSLFIGSHYTWGYLPQESLRLWDKPSFTGPDRGLRPARSLDRTAR